MVEKHLKIFSMSLGFREMQIETEISSHSIQNGQVSRSDDKMQIWM